MKDLLIIFIITHILIPVLPGQNWIVPDNKKDKLSSFPFTDETSKKGEKLYTINCMSCHGTPGKANYLSLIPPPGDPATEKIQHNKDGEIFYKVTAGRGPMPSFKNVLSSNDIWCIISFIRSFNSTYKQQVMQIITSSAYPGAEISIRLSFLKGESTVLVAASAVKENRTVPVSGAAVKLYIHRTFGLLPVDEEKTTDNEGVAKFRIPDHLPGDSAGNIHIIARFTDEEVFGSVSKDSIMCVAEKTYPVSLVKERAMWNSVRKAPVWIIVAFSIGLFSVWGFIFYVLLQLRDIYIIGDNFSNELKDKET